MAHKKVTALAFLAIALMFLVSRGYILMGLQPQPTDLGSIYFTNAVKAVDLRQVPYKDFLVEYPPVAWWTIYLPRLVHACWITHENGAGQVVPVYSTYSRIFRGLMFLCDAGVLLLLTTIGRRRGVDWFGWGALAYTVTTALLGHVLYDRLDMGLLFLLMLWAECWTRSLENSQSGRTIAWSAASYAALGLSISYKLIPILCVPLLLVSEFNAPRRWSRLAMAILPLGTMAVLPFAVQYAVSGPSVFVLFQYHGERGIQIESLYATLMMISSAFGTPPTVTATHGSFELTGPLTQSLKIASVLALVSFLTVMGFWALIRRSRFSREKAYPSACFVIPASVILSNVISPQYFVWALPLLLLLGNEIFPEKDLRRWILAILLIVIAGLTTWIFPYHYFASDDNTIGLLPSPFADGSSPWPLVSGIVGARNLIYLSVIIWLGAMSVRCTRATIQL
jgi:hypothetical protein